MVLYVARHAWAGRYGDPAWPDDSKRPLTDKGTARYRRLLAELTRAGFAPQRVATSPYARCVQTAALIAEACGAKVDKVAELAPGASAGPLLGWCERAGAEQLCLVGHNPDVEQITARLIGDRDAAVRFAKGAVAAIRFETPPPVLAEGTLLWHATAKLLGV